MEEFSFQNGWSQLRQKDVAECKEKIMVALGLTTRSGLGYRRNGDVGYTPAEQEAVERIFAEYGITEVWGKVQ